jgi:uncharacterized protein YcnI
VSALFYLLPALLLLGALLLGRYPGERLLLAAAARRALRPARAARTTPRRGRPLPALLPRGSALLAAALAGRAPPPHHHVDGTKSPVCQGKSSRQHLMSEFELRLRRSFLMRKNAFVVAGALAALVVPATASAHVSVHPNEVPTGAFATLDIRVPNESDKANTTKIAVQLPPGFIDVSPEYMQGWTPDVRTTKLAKPVKTDDGLVTEGVKEIVWSGGKIPPGQFLNFPISTEIPGKAGQTLTFKVLQYYDDGEVARWIGGPDSEEPAPDIDVTAAGGPLQDVAGTEAEAPAPGGEANVTTKENVLAPTSSSSSGGGGASKGLAIAALLVGALGLLAGGAALLRGRGAAA